MRQTRMIGLCLIVALAAAAVASASASAAQPEFKTTLAGKLTATTLVTKSTKGVAESVVCKKGTAVGEISGPSSFSQTIKYLECKAGTTPCGNVGAETIETGSLGGELYGLNKAETQLGALEESTSGAFASFKCGTATVEVQGFLVGTFTNFKTGFKYAYTVTSGKQTFRSFFAGGEELSPFFLGTELEGEVGVLHESTIKTTETLTPTVNA